MPARLAAILVLCLLALPLSAAGRPCVGGKGQAEGEVSGYRFSVTAAASAEQRGECRARVRSPGGALVFETQGAEAGANLISGKDVNGDAFPDLVIETVAGGQLHYFVISLAEPAGLLREFAVSVPLHFEDLDGDGRVEIWARDYAFRDFDGLPAAVSPAPRVIFRLKGAALVPVSQAFWSEYEREIAEARGRISRDALDDFIAVPVQGDENRKPKELSQEEQAKQTDLKGTVLEIVLAHLYGGRGQQAWKALDEMWPATDRPRIRQMILKARTSGILSEINRPKK